MKTIPENQGAWGKRVREVALSPAAGDALAVCAGLLFLALCMVLPLVAKAACGGSGSPGAGPMDTLSTNMAFFVELWVLTALAAGGALGLKLRRWKAEGEPFPKAVAGLSAVLLALGLALACGWLKL